MAEVEARLPEWVVTRDGRRVPFDADAICADLFAVTEELGRPNAFLARELTDAVVHFLARSLESATPATSEIADVAVKVIRGLDHGAVAQAFALRATRARLTPAVPDTQVEFAPTDAPDAVVRRCLHAYSLQAVFSRDIAAAAADGLLQLGGLETPAALATCVVDGATDSFGLAQSALALARIAGQTLVLDGPEWQAPDDGALRASFCRWLLALPTLLGRAVTVNVGCHDAPSWARTRGGGPLFPVHGEQRSRHDFLHLLLETWRDSPSNAPRLHWHLRVEDVDGERLSPEWREAIGLALTGADIAFICDRPKRPIALGDGVDRLCPATLLEVGLDLDAFLRWDDIAGDGARFQEKLPSLVRMAVSAGAQKRQFLRRQASDEIARGFLLDRARLVVVPLGLDAVVRRLAGRGAAGSTLALECARSIVEILASAVTAAGRAVHLEAVLGNGSASSALAAADSSQTPQKQLAAAGRIQRGMATVLCPASAELNCEAIVELLRFAFRRTDVQGVVFQRECGSEETHLE